MLKIFKIFLLILLVIPTITFASHRTIDDREADFRSSYSRSIRKKIEKLDDNPVKDLKIPILFGMSVDDIRNDWGDPRGSNGEREHEGNDILAPRGAFIVSPTEAVVASIGYGTLGGNYVYTFNPGNERYYYAHLDKVAEGLEAGDVLEPGDFIGYVGDTGNADGGVPHLHFGIYKRGAINPYPRLIEEFSLDEKMSSLKKLLANEDSPKKIAKSLVKQYRKIFEQAREEGIELSEEIETIFKGEEAISSLFKRDLKIGDTGTDIFLLQTLLNRKGVIVSNTGPGSPGNETSYFGPATQSALSRFQEIHNIKSTGETFNSATREKIGES